ncbi:MAG: ATP-binding protein [Candidatus Riflebacteria bacterium]|nr:ATP-binding protein [Candidatus Riflebacteria bacterium]
MDPRLALTVRNTLQESAQASARAQEYLDSQAVPADVAYSVALVIEELVTNTVQYGYTDAAEHLIEVLVTLTADEIVLLIKDDGREFDPLQTPPPDLDLPVADRPIGGLGIHLVHKVCTRLSYERRDRENLVTVRFDRNPPAAGE